MTATPRTPIDNRQERRLFAAIEDGKTDIVDDMLERLGTHTVLSMELPGYSVMQAAVDSGHEQILELLLEEGADANETVWNGDSLLHVAIRKGRPKIVRLLLEYGADTSSINYNGRQPLQMAVAENLPEMAKLIISHRSDPVKTFETATKWLRYARENGMDEMAAALEDLTESFDQHDPEFKLYKAIINNNHRAIVDLLEQHVDPFAVKLGTKKMSALHVASRQRDVRVLAMLLSKLDKHGRVDAQDNAGQTPLHYAAAKNSVANVDWLLFSGADPDIRDIDGKQAEDVGVSQTVRRMLFECWTSVPDAIIAMRGEWFRELPRADCTLSRSPHQPSDKDLPAVLMFRCITEDARKDEHEWAQFERSSFSVDELCLEVYEYRCSEPDSPVQFLIDLQDRDLDSEELKLVLKHRCKGGVVSSEKLTVSGDMAAGCEVILSTSGHLAVVCQDQHRVVTVPVGRAETDIQPTELPGLELQIPQDTFRHKQEILIKAEEPPPLPSTSHNPEMPDIPEEAGPPNEEDMSVIKNLSCFYNIVNTGNERPHKSMLMSIPMETKTANVMTLFLRQAGLENPDEEPLRAENFKGIEELEIAEEIAGNFTQHTPGGHHQQTRKSSVACAPSPDDERDTSSYEYDYSDDEFEEDEETTEVSDRPAWIASSDVIVNQEQAVISTDLPDMGVVVAAEVRPGVTPEEVITAIQALYTQNHKKEILIFTVAKAAPGNTAEVMVCFVSEERYEPVIRRLEGQGYRCMAEPKVAYAFRRETFRLRLKGNLKDIYAEEDFSIVEYQVGGRLSHTTFVLKVIDGHEPATGAIVVTRTTRDNSQYSSVGILHLDLTPLFGGHPGSARGGHLSAIDNTVLELSQTMSTDNIRVYCYALGMTKDELKTITIKGKSLTPSEKNFRMLSLTRSGYRSEIAFFTHLEEVLERHKERKAVALLKKTLRETF